MSQSVPNIKINHQKHISNLYKRHKDHLRKNPSNPLLKKKNSHVLWPQFFVLRIFQSPCNVLKTNSTGRTAIEKFLRPPKVKTSRKTSNHMLVSSLSKFRNLLKSNESGPTVVDGFYSIIFSTCAMTSILFSTHFLASGQRFENK